LLEVLVLAAVVVVLAFVLVPKTIHRRKPSVGTRCVNNLKNIGLAFRIFGTDNSGAFPRSVSTNEGGSLEWLANGEIWRQWAVLSNELSTPKLLACPEDLERPAALNWAAFDEQRLSYFLNVAALSEPGDLVLSGDRNLVLDGTPTARGRVRVSATNQVSWGPKIHHHSGNLLLADGSVHQSSSAGVNVAFQKSAAAGTNDLLIP